MPNVKKYLYPNPGFPVFCLFHKSIYLCTHKPTLKTKKTMKKIALLLFVFTITIFTGAKAQSHPAYLHALSDLRAARWMLEHRPGDWKQTEDEISAVKKIDDAIGEIKKAAIDDGKDLNDHPAAQEINEHAGRLKKAMEYLQRARGDIEK
jgi:hypothetical protein